ncbi:MAG TPA: response regulator [Actinomycetota bacterium]|nr:response regulator [Actinomycetota bacterium]
MTTGRSDLVLVEDDADYRLLIRVTLGADPRFEMTGEAPTVESGIELAREAHPSLIILDHNLEGEMVGLAAAPQLKEAAPESKILLFTAYDLEAEARREPAVDAYLRKDEIGKLLPTAQRLLGLEPVS